VSGFRVFDPDPATLRWAQAAQRVALELARDPAIRADNLRHAGTWFVGVDALPMTRTAASAVCRFMAPGWISSNRRTIGTARSCPSSIPAIRGRTRQRVTPTTGSGSTVTPRMWTGCCPRVLPAAATCASRMASSWACL
jgi:hypothetical protein